MSAVMEINQVQSEQNKLERNQVRLVLQKGLQILLLLAIAWLAFYAFYESFPYVRNSTSVVISAKRRLLTNEWEFPDSAEYRIYIMGNSTTLSGFIPSEFDSLDPERIYSINGGLPGNSEFIPELEGMVARGQIPTHVFLTMPWSAESLDNELLKTTDQRIMNVLFPFSSMIHDVGLFLSRSLSHGGIRNYYELTRSEVESMIENRGYLFIVTQSRYPNDILPEDFSEPADTPNSPAAPRIVDTESEAFQHLLNLNETYGIQFIFVPTYNRISRRATPPEENLALAESLADYPGFHVLGADYVVYPHSYFADSLHLNPNGASIYTAMLRELFETEYYSPQD